jgi:zeta-carotene isomerase
VIRPPTRSPWTVLYKFRHRLSSKSTGGKLGSNQPAIIADDIKAAPFKDDLSRLSILDQNVVTDRKYLVQILSKSFARLATNLHINKHRIHQFHQEAITMMGSTPLLYPKSHQAQGAAIRYNGNMTVTARCLHGFVLCCLLFGLPSAAGFVVVRQSHHLQHQSSSRSLVTDRTSSQARIKGYHASLLRLDARSRNGPEEETTTTTALSAQLVGDDAAAFDWQEQKWADWGKFTVATGTVLAAIAWLWVLPTGPHGGDVFLQTVQSTLGTNDPAVTVAAMLIVFAISHSGLAGLRTYAEPIVGARTWRVLFAVVSLPLALSCISYFVNHAHEGIQLWDVTDVPGLHAGLWLANFVSFLFLYPSTFNLLEIAAIERPQLHLWETGIIRITRHPQAAGQILWCAAHTMWLGTSTAAAASAILVLHHVFSVWHGDRRLKTRHGEAFDYIQSKTSVVPFAAILDGRQELPEDYITKELLRLPYAVVVGGTVAAYFAHPYMQAGAALLHW